MLETTAYCRKECLEGELMEWNPKKREPFWQEAWNDAKAFESDVDHTKEKFFTLEMYPYPSGNMHMGHVRNYSIGDAIARSKRAMGFNVLYPMGFDSFGMPAENAAIAEGGHPREITDRNMDSITAQFKRMGFSYDWRRKVMSHDPHYYRWNQYFFLKFLENDLAYRKFAPVNWCVECATVLANEQVKNGRCWRCANEVSQKDMSQWFLKITNYSQQLLDSLEDIDFPEHVKSLQRDWLGRSEGADISFQIAGDEGWELEAFTTRPDTIFGVTFVTLAPEHPLAKRLVEATEYEQGWRELCNEVATLSEFDRGMLKEKKGVSTGRFAIHPLTGNKIPIWVGNFVLSTYGTGAVMAVPAHDKRDFAFAKKYSIPIIQALVEKENDDVDEEMKKPIESYGYMANVPANYSELNGLFAEEAKKGVISILQQLGKGKGTIQWKIRDWLISRQRYWGTPIPIIHCEKCGAVPVPYDQLPVELPDDVQFTGQGNPLETSDSFCNVKCPACGIDARRETDTMDTFVDSSWYFLRYTDAMNHDLCFSKEEADYWMNVDFYCGGIEHAQMHLIYSRFWTKALRDLGFHSSDEPFQELLCQGMVNKPAPYCKKCKITLHVDNENKECPQCGDLLGMRTAKMSKSLGNTVSPGNLIEKYGADTVRLFILFAAQPEAGMDWSNEGVEAAWRQINLLYSIPNAIIEWSGNEGPVDNWLIAITEQRKIEWMEAINAADLRKAVEISHYELVKDINWYVRRGGENSTIGLNVLGEWCLMLQAVTPHLAEEWWHLIGGQGLNALRIFSKTEGETTDSSRIISKERYLRNFLENARSTIKLAERHIGSPPTKAVIQTAFEWKNTLSLSALQFMQEGGNVKNFQSIIQQMPLAQGEKRGEVLGFWNKKLLPQLFKWSDHEKGLIFDAIDEAEIISSTTQFICKELGLIEIEVWQAGEGEDIGGRADAAMPLRPSLFFE
jgi:leucyl-tRNA synthetase